MQAEIAVSRHGDLRAGRLFGDSLGEDPPRDLLAEFDFRRESIHVQRPWQFNDRYNLIPSIDVFNITNNANQPALSGLQRAANLPPGDRRFLAIPAACSSAYASNGEKLALPMGARLHCDPALFYCQESAFPA